MAFRSQTTLSSGVILSFRTIRQLDRLFLHHEKEAETLGTPSERQETTGTAGSFLPEWVNLFYVRIHLVHVVSFLVTPTNDCKRHIYTFKPLLVYDSLVEQGISRSM